MPTHSLHRLEDVDLAVLDDLLDAGVGCAVDAAAAPAIRRNNCHGSVIRSLTPAFYHIHQLNEAVGGRGNRLTHRPTRQLEQLHGLRWRFHACHELRQRDDLLVYAEHLLRVI